ncbi:programmed cell death protein 1-like isoform X2 [Engraulis encrasicolus]|uniref:programmed cell death protein 1-like isoform X2 n=1 Tax=Engraulis encrasicolus TaxID=184585 RepID=UPI002FD50FDB
MTDGSYTMGLPVDLCASWVVKMPTGPLKALVNSSIVLPCSYDYPEQFCPAMNRTCEVLSEMWCLNQESCITQRYVHHSAGIFPEPAYAGRVTYLGTLGSRNCSLRISELRASDSGVYVFRFITEHPAAKLPGQRGIRLVVEEDNTHRKDAVSSKDSTGVVLWTIGILLAVVLAAAAVFFCKRRATRRSQHTIVMTHDEP